MEKIENTEIKLNNKVYSNKTEILTNSFNFTFDSDSQVNTFKIKVKSNYPKYKKKIISFLQGNSMFEKYLDAHSSKWILCGEYIFCFNQKTKLKAILAYFDKFKLEFNKPPEGNFIELALYFESEPTNLSSHRESLTRALLSQVFRSSGYSQSYRKLFVNSSQSTKASLYRNTGPDWSKFLKLPDIKKGFNFDFKQDKICIFTEQFVVRKETFLELYSVLVKSFQPVSRAQFIFKKVILNRMALTVHNDRVYSIHRIDFFNSPESVNVVYKGKLTTMYQYFVLHHGIKLEKNQFLLVSKVNNKEVFLPPQLSRIIGGYDYENIRFDSDRCLLDKFSNILNRIKDIFPPFNVSEPEVKSGVVLKPVKLYSRKEKQNFTITEVGRFKMTEMIENCEFLGSLKNWAVIYFQDFNKESLNVYTSFIKTAKKQFKMKIDSPEVFKITKPKDFYNELSLKYGEKLKSKSIVMILSSHFNQYDDLKRAVHKIAPMVPSQVILLSSSFKRHKLEIFENLALQMCSKTGLNPWKIKSELNHKKTVFVGIDTMEINTFTSVTALCASFENSDKTLFYYFKHENYGNISPILVRGILKAVEFYLNQTKKQPETVIIYRKRGRAELSLLKEMEAEPLEACLRCFGIKLVFFGVWSSQNTRLFGSYSESAGERNDSFSENIRICSDPPIGTLVETEEEMFPSFCLINYFTDKYRNSKPTVYAELLNTSSLSKEYLNYWTYALCFVYYNKMGCIHIPAVVRNATNIANYCSKILGTHTCEEYVSFRNFAL